MTLDLDKLETLLTGPLPDDIDAVLLAAAPELIAAARMLEELRSRTASLLAELRVLAESQRGELDEEDVRHLFRELERMANAR